MLLWHIFLLAIVQGITEFLPISSSAHLVLFPKVTGGADQGLIIDLAVHVGSLLAVMLVFFKEVILLTKTTILYPKATKEERKLLQNVLIGSIPVIIAGAIFYALLPDGLRNVQLIAAMSIIFGILLFWADRVGKIDKKCMTIGKKDAFLIGLAHIIALIPGVSRSGITMTMARARGMTRFEAARFSMLIGMPVIAGAGTVGLYDLIKAGNIELGIDALFAMFFSFIASLISILLMLKWLQKFSFTPFVIYRILLGIAIFAFVL